MARTAALIALLVAAAAIALPQAADARLRRCGVKLPELETLQVQNIRCDSGRLLWQAVAAPGIDYENFQLYGLRWRCAIYYDDGYTMTCRAKGDRVMRYRWRKRGSRS